MKIRVFVVEHHATLQRAVAALIANEADLEICGVAGQAADALVRITAQRPDIVIIDVARGDGSGLELAQAIRTRLSEVAVVVFSLTSEAELALKALRAGALAFVSKAEEPANLLEAIRNVRAGHMRVGNEAVRASLSGAVKRMRQQGGARQEASLAEVEQEFMALTAEGRSTPEIAAVLGLSVLAVKRIRANLKRKLHCATAVDLIRLCVLASKRERSGAAGNSPRARRLQDQVSHLAACVGRIEQQREDLVQRRRGAMDSVMVELDERLEVNERTLAALRRTLSVTRLELEMELRGSA